MRLGRKQPWHNQGTTPGLAWRGRETAQGTLVKMAGVPVEIRTDNLPNTSLEGCCYPPPPLGGDDDEDRILVVLYCCKLKLYSRGMRFSGGDYEDDCLLGCDAV
jgi:hypothetical protein